MVVNSINTTGALQYYYSQGFVEEILVELFHAGLLHLSLSAGSVRAPFPLFVPPLQILACVHLEVPKTEEISCCASRG